MILCIGYYIHIIITDVYFGKKYYDNENWLSEYIAYHVFNISVGAVKIFWIAIIIVFGTSTHKMHICGVSVKGH